MRKLPWGLVKQGPYAGQLVPELDVNPSINLIRDRKDCLIRGSATIGETNYKARVFDNRFRRVYWCGAGNAKTFFIHYRGCRYRVGW